MLKDVILFCDAFIICSSINIHVRGKRLRSDEWVFSYYIILQYCQTFSFKEQQAPISSMGYSTLIQDNMSCTAILQTRKHLTKKNNKCSLSITVCVSGLILESITGNFKSNISAIYPSHVP